ncbi:MAG: glycosyltransferase [Candidatus Omnitrophica bacterium]|nr:glycosyltransferase [Candidatus Omnitrophota bacterium]
MNYSRNIHFKDLPLVSVVIPTHNRKEKLIRLIDSIIASDYPMEKIEIVVIDDASTDGTYEAVKRGYSNIKIMRNKINYKVSTSRNIGILNSNGEYIFFIDDDTIIEKDTIWELVEFMQNNGKAIIVGPAIYNFYQPLIFWTIGVKINFWTCWGKFIAQNERDIGQYNQPFECDGLPTAFMIHRDVIKFVGFFNSAIFPTAFEELDFCIRAKYTGLKVIVLPTVRIFHEPRRAAYLDNAENIYLGARNRIIAHKLWSRNYLQYIISKGFAIFFNLLFLIMKNTLYTKNRWECTKAILKGTKDGLRISSTIDSYAEMLKKGKDIRYNFQV